MHSAKVEQDRDVQQSGAATTRLKAALAALLLAVVSMGAVGCEIGADVREGFATEVVVERSLWNNRPPGGQVTVSKVYRFSTENPLSADRIVLEDIFIAVSNVIGEDLTFLRSVDVFIVRSNDDRVQLANGSTFVEGEQVAVLDLMYDGDARNLVADDGSLELEFVVTFAAKSVYPDFPADGIPVLIQARMLLDF